MGENSKNYQNGKIYCIRNYLDDEIFIGSSCQPLSKRMAWHRQAYNRKKTMNRPLYRKMNDLGVEHFYIELIEDFSCERVEQLRRREGELIRERNPVLNKDIAGRTKNEWNADNPERVKRYNQNHRKNNSERLKEKDRQYYKNNKDQRKEYQVEYRQINKDTINEKRSVQIDCECGGHYTLSHKARHFKAQCHQNFLSNNI